MKNILCFGDSNTFGFVPEDGSRYDKNTRWSGQLQNLLKDGYKVIEAGCNNRTAFTQNPAGTLFTGIKILPDYLTHHKELHLVIIAAGINDLQFSYQNSIDDIYAGMKKLVRMTKERTSAKILLIIPSVIKKSILKSFFAAMFDESSIEKSLKLPQIYKTIAKEENIQYIDLNNVAETSDIDGLHYSSQAHTKIAIEVAKKIRQIL